MKKFLFSSFLLLFVGSAMAQTVAVTANLVNTCVSTTSATQLKLESSIPNLPSVSAIQWILIDPSGATTLNTTVTPTPPSTMFTEKQDYHIMLSQPGTYTAIMHVSYGGKISSDSVRVTLYPLPQFSLQKSRTDSICPGEKISFDFILNPPHNLGMIKNVLWNFGDGGTSTDSKHVYPNGGNTNISYRVSLSITDTNGCMATVDSNNYVYVRSKPEVDFVSDTTYFCFGTNVVNLAITPKFTNYTDTGRAGITNTYLWKFGDGNTSNSTNAVIPHTYQVPDTNSFMYNVTLIAKDQYGCTDSLSMPNYIKVRQIKSNFTISDTIICSLSPPTTIRGTGRELGLMYNWQIRDVANGEKTGINPEWTFRYATDVGIHKLYVTITDQAERTCILIDSSISLHIYDKVKAKIKATDTNECDPNNAITFVNATQYYPWANDFGMGETKWDFGDGRTQNIGDSLRYIYGTSASPNGDSYYFDNGYGDYRVTMSGTTPYGCHLEAVHQDIHIFRMRVAAEILSPAPPNSPHGCAPHTVDFMNNQDSLKTSSPIVSCLWKWNHGGVLNPTGDPSDTTGGNQNLVQHTYTDTGHYYVYLTLTNEQGCVHDIYVAMVMVGNPPRTDFTFVSDTACKSAINIRVMAYDSITSGVLEANAWANEWTWLDDGGNLLAYGDTTNVSPNETGSAFVTLISSHNGCQTNEPVRKENMGYVCPPVAVIDSPRDDSPGIPPLFCGLEEIPFINASKGAIYLRWYAGDYFPAWDTAHNSKSHIMRFDTNTMNFDTIGGNWAFTYANEQYLYDLNGIITVYLYAKNDGSILQGADTLYKGTDSMKIQPHYPDFYNPCIGRNGISACEHVTEQKLIISVAKMNFTASQYGVCQGDSVRFNDSTKSSAGIFGWGFKFDSAWNNSSNYLEPWMTNGYVPIGVGYPIKAYQPDPTHHNGQWITFTRPNKYRMVLQDTCVFGCKRNDTLILSVYPKSIPDLITSIDGINYKYGKVDTICVDAGAKLYLRDTSYSPHPFENTVINSWTWGFGSNGYIVDSATGKNAVLSPKQANLYDLYLTVRNEHGCDSTREFREKLLVNNVIPSFIIAGGYTKEFCNRTAIMFENMTTVMPISNRNTYMKLVYEWGDGDTTVFYAKSQDRIIKSHTYNLPNLVNKVYVKLTASIIADTITKQPIGCEDVYIDSLIINRPIAAFTDDGHEFPCPNALGGSPGRLINFTNQSQGKLQLLTWNFGDGKQIIGIINDHSVINPAHLYEKAGNYDVSLIVMDSNMCRDSAYRKGHVKILGPRGDFKHRINGNDCRLVEAFFRPTFDSKEFLPDTIYVVTGDGERKMNTGDSSRLVLEMRHVYQVPGVYLPTYFLYKTVDFKGVKETCIIQINEKDSIYVIEITPNFAIEPLYCPQAPITINNTSAWRPNHLPCDSVSWVFGNGNTSQDYDGSTVYNSIGNYSVSLTMKVLNCVGKTSKYITLSDSVVVPNITSSTLPFGIINTAYSTTLTATGCNVIWSMENGNLPAGLSLNTVTGEISGTATTTGMFNFTVKASNGVGNITKAFSIIINNYYTKSISGKALRQNQTLLSAGVVLLYQVQPTAQYSLIASVPIRNDGYYFFPDVPSDSYIIKVIPQSSENALTTYYGNTEVWNNAFVVTVSNTSFQNINITIIPRPAINGSSFISGYVGEDERKSNTISQKSVTFPVEDVDVYLQKQQNNTWNTVAQTLTNIEGYFEFRNLPAGRYKVILDIPGLLNKSSHIIEINDGDTVKNLEYEITKNGINVSINSFKKAKENMRVYPNPTNGQLIIETGLSTTENSVRYSIYSITGQAVMQGTLPCNDAVCNVFIINVESLPKGMYFLRIENATVKFVKN